MKKNEKGEWVYNNGQKAIWWNPYEADVIAPYMMFIGDFGKWPRYQKLMLKSGTILFVEFNGYSDSDNDLELDDPNYEECYEFDFKILKIKNKPKDCKWKKGETIFLNYHNFPIQWEKLGEEDIKKLKLKK